MPVTHEVASSTLVTPAIILAQIAQSVEQGTENPRVGGSIPPGGTIYSNECLDTHLNKSYLSVKESRP